MVNRALNRMLTDEGHPLWRRKGYSTRLHKHRYRVTCKKLERINARIKSGQLVDLDHLKEQAERSKPKEDATLSQFRAMADYKNHYFRTRLPQNLMQQAVKEMPQPIPRTVIGATFDDESYMQPDVQQVVQDVGPREEEDIFATLDDTSPFEQMLMMRNQAMRQEEIDFTKYMQREGMDTQERELLQTLQSQNNPLSKMLHQFFKFKVENEQAEHTQVLESEQKMLLHNLKRHLIGGLASTVGSIVPTLTEPLRSSTNTFHALKKSLFDNSADAQIEWLANQMAHNSAIGKAIEEREELEARIKFERFMKSQRMEFPYKTWDEQQAARRHQEHLRNIDQELKIETYLKRMQEQRERQLEYERAVIHMAMEQNVADSRPQHLTVAKLREMVEHVEPVEFGYPGNRIKKQQTAIKTREEIAREMMRRHAPPSISPQMSQQTRRSLEEQFDDEFTRRLGQVPVPHQESTMMDEDLDKFQHMQTFGRHNRRVGERSRGLSDHDKMEIEREAEKLHQLVRARSEMLQQNKLSLKSLVSYFRGSSNE